MNEQSTHFGRLREGNEYLHDPEGLSAFLDEEGYLFFRGVMEGVGDLKAAFVNALQEQGAAEPGV
jgi:hypothetical protein